MCATSSPPAITIAAVSDEGVRSVAACPDRGRTYNAPHQVRTVADQHGRTTQPDRARAELAAARAALPVAREAKLNAGVELRIFRQDVLVPFKAGIEAANAAGDMVTAADDEEHAMLIEAEIEFVAANKAICCGISAGTPMKTRASNICALSTAATRALSARTRCALTSRRSTSCQRKSAVSNCWWKKKPWNPSKAQHNASARRCTPSLALLASFVTPTLLPRAPTPSPQRMHYSSPLLAAMPGRSPECRQHARARAERAKAAADPDAGIDVPHDERTPVERADVHYLSAMLAMLGHAIALTLPPASNKRHASRMPLLYLPLRFALLEGIDAYEEERESARTRQVYRRRHSCPTAGHRMPHTSWKKPWKCLVSNTSRRPPNRARRQISAFFN